MDADNRMQLMEVFRCSNPNCTAMWDADPHGHCPACIQTNGSGWSTYRLTVHHLLDRVHAGSDLG